MKTIRIKDADFTVIREGDIGVCYAAQLQYKDYDIFIQSGKVTTLSAKNKYFPTLRVEDKNIVINDVSAGDDYSVARLKTAIEDACEIRNRADELKNYINSI